jgi:isochorismate synthase
VDREPENYAYYRLPGQHGYTFVAQTREEPTILDSVTELNGREGFVMAPFAVSEQHPVLLMHPDVVETHEIETQTLHESSPTAVTEQATQKVAYAADFNKFHAETQTGKFDKIVLSRCAQVALPNGTTAKALFEKACTLYPQQFTALVSMQKAGTWLMATPEALLDGRHDEWHTMAVAGTMKREASTHDVAKTVWSKKNREEQLYVSTYIKEILNQYSDTVSEHGPYTTTAAHLLHLRTDFTFRLNDAGNIGTLIEALYPTPAVCGIPKEAARAFITAHESVDRKYYSGFCGPLSLQGETHLYVALRCMEMLGNTLRLYAGGGILRDSEMKSEWQETQTKMQTMLRLLNTQP